MIGKTLSHYRVVEKIGAGGMGEVYRARDEHLGRDVALKVLPAGTLGDEHARKRFRKEALALSKLNHPNIATVFDFDTQDGTDFLVMELVEGVTLSDKLAGGPLPEKEITRLGMQLAEALEEAHERGVVHRDLKPGNVMVTPKGQAKILDFGLAKLVRPEVASATATTESFTETQAAAGTLPYMAPEQLRGEGVDARTDIHALGAVLYEMATGQRPFPETQGPRLIDAILHQAPQAPSGLNRRVSPGLEGIILKALEKEPENRYQSAKEIAVDLRRLGTPGSAAAVLSARRQGMVLAVGIALVALVAVLVGLNVGGLRQRLLGGATPPPGKIMLAVLPFDNLSADPEQEYFSDGLTEEMIAQLGRLHPQRLGVIARTSAMHYKGTDKNVDEIGRELGVDYILEGSVRRAADRVRITAQLIQVSDQTHLWAESYERDLEDIFALQSGVAQAVARQIELKLAPEQLRRVASPHPVNAEAYDLYLKGRYHFNRWDFPKSIQYYKQAIEKDPGYAPPYAGLSLSYCARWFGGDLSLSDSHARSEAAAAKALELDDTLGEAHTALAHIKFLYQWDWLGGLREYRRAVELDPNSYFAHWEYALGLSPLGRHEEAIAEMKQALALDPFSLLMNTALGDAYYFARQYENALEQYLETIELDPNFAGVHWSLGEVYEQKGMHREAVEEYLRARTLWGESVEKVEALRRAYEARGIKGFWQKHLVQLKETAKRGPALPLTFVSIYSRLGDKDQAFAWLEKAYEEHSGPLISLKVSPDYDPLRSDPRFQSLLRRMNFPE